VGRSGIDEYGDVGGAGPAAARAVCDHIDTVRPTIRRRCVGGCSAGEFPNYCGVWTKPLARRTLVPKRQGARVESAAGVELTVPQERHFGAAGSQGLRIFSLACPWPRMMSTRARIASAV
jgi:hypothetical protein